MKNKGIIRKMDELGRIVVPREYRKINRINVGDPMSISLLENGDILLSKADYISDLMSYGEVACKVLSAETSNTILLLIGKEIKAGSGVGANLLIGQTVEKELAESIEKSDYYFNEDSKLEQYKYLLGVPIKDKDKNYGAIIMLSDVNITSYEQKVTQIVSKIIVNILQNY